MIPFSTLAVLSLCVILVFGQHGHQHGHRHQHSARQATRPNVLVIMTDDQDSLLDSMSAMPNTKALIGNNGVTYQKHYCQVALCCPSRVSFFTGRAAHNTNVTDVQPPYGGWPKFASQGLNDNYLPVWLKNAGIKTYYVGKLFNSLSETNLATPAPPRGWTNSSFLVDPYIANYLHSHWTTKPNAQSRADTAAFDNIHTTDVTNSKALDMLDQAAASGGPFFMMVAGVAPHLQSASGASIVPPVPAKWNGAFAGRNAPRGANFNPTKASGASWVSHLPRLTSTQVQTGDTIYQARLGNLAAIDDMIYNLITKLQTKGLLDSTYILFTSDNGFHIGNHRLTAGKRCPYEEDINVPLLIRGPDVAKGVTSNLVHGHVDMAPTILQMFGLAPQSSYAFDGSAIPYTTAALGSTTAKTEFANVEFWTSAGNPEGLPQGLYYNNTYKALRLFSDGNSFYYSKWCTGEQEFYNMVSDPSQMTNRLANPTQGKATQYYGRPERQLYSRLDALLMVQKSCKQNSCRNPWATLFPGGQVTNLAGAMAAQYDSFFASQPKVSYSSCQVGYILSQEGPQTVTPFS